jgi:AcrR family transcriptional regulator
VSQPRAAHRNRPEICGRLDSIGGIAARRSYNAPQRRRDIADAAIVLLGSDGAHGLSHPRVDQKAGLPAGTTSYHFPTRQALVHGIAERITELDVADLALAAGLDADGDGDGHFSGTLGFARLVMFSATDPGLTRARARHELALAARRNPDLAATMSKVTTQIYGLARDVVAGWTDDRPPADVETIEERAVTVLTYVSGVMLSFVYGRPAVTDAHDLDRHIRAMLSGLAAQ